MVFEWYCHVGGVRSGAVGWGTSLQAWTSQIILPIESLSFSLT